MREVISELKSRVGVRGALVLTPDGVVVAADLCDGLDPNSVAALASASVGMALRAAGTLDLGEPRRVTLSARFGRLVFVPFDEFVLAVVIEPGLDLELTLLEIAGPARRLRDLSRLDSPM